MTRHREACDFIDGLQMQTHPAKADLAKLTAKHVSSIVGSVRGLAALAVLQTALLAVLVWKVW